MTRKPTLEMAIVCAAYATQRISSLRNGMHKWPKFGTELNISPGSGRKLDRCREIPSHQLSQFEIGGDNPCSQQLSGKTLSVSEERVNEGLEQSARSIPLGAIPLLPFRSVRGNHGSSAALVAVR